MSAVSIRGNTVYGIFCHFCSSYFSNTALLITNTENIKTKAGIEIVNEMNGNILELKNSVNPERDIYIFSNEIN